MEIALGLALSAAPHAPAADATPAASPRVGDEAFRLSGWRVSGNGRVRRESVPGGSGHALRFDLSRDDHIPYRSEIALDSGRLSISVGREYWFAFRILLPGSCPLDDTGELVAQWHSRPDTHLGERWRPPPLALEIQRRRFVWVSRSDPRRVTRRGDVPIENGIGAARYAAGEAPHDEWIEWKVRATFSPTAHGSLQIWRNETLVASRPGPNTYNDSPNALFFKIGLYKWPWKPGDRRFEPRSSASSRCVVFDDVRAGRGAAALRPLLPR